MFFFAKTSQKFVKLFKMTEKGLLQKKTHFSFKYSFYYIFLNKNLLLNIFIYNMFMHSFIKTIE